MREETTWGERKEERRKEVDVESGEEDRGTGPGQSIAPTSTHHQLLLTVHLSAMDITL